MADRTVDAATRKPLGVEVGAEPPTPPGAEHGERVTDDRSSVQRFAERLPDLLASYLAAVATFCAVTAVLPPLREPLRWLQMAIEIVSVGAPPSLATAAFLGILAAAVRRRMRAAWWFVVVYVVLGRVLGWITVLVVTDAVDPVTVSIEGGTTAWLRVGFGVVALVLLVLARDQFTARTPRGNGWRALDVPAVIAAAASGTPSTDFEDPVAAQLAVRHAELPEQVRVRHAKYERMLSQGLEPYPVGYPRTVSVAQVRERFGHLPPDAATGERVSVTGRVVRARDLGGLCFAVLRESDADLQVMLSADQLGRQGLRDWTGRVDLGDHVGVTGEVVTSRRGELSVLVADWTITAKCLRPLPDKRRGLSDPEARVRQRYLDLVVNPPARRMLRRRSDAVRAVREYLAGRGYLEVETPMLQPVHGGANARPFVTHINAYDMRLYLRIAPELYLKRLMVGGAEKVFELNRNFRNEGADATHNPEFTMLEAYEAYGDYDTMQVLMREMIQQAARAALGGTVVVHEGREYDLGGDWRSTTVNAAISQALGEEVTADTSVEQLRCYCDRVGVAYDPAWGRGAILLELYEHLVEDRTLEPTFYRDFPTDVSPLTRQHRADPRLAERWDLVCFGAEIGTAYSELVDPVEQRRRLTEQSLLAAGGDAEAMELDEDFLLALEYAMPPSGGLGMGVDRMIMMLTGRSIRETVLFPIVRPGS